MSDPTHVCFYHFPCNDGIASAWVVSQSLPNAELMGVKPGCKEIDPEKYNGKYIYFTDVCPNLELLTRLLDLGNRVTILDHHISNQRMLEEIPGGDNLHITFDMNRSGCQITWDHFNPDPDDEQGGSFLRPWFIDYIGDRDLWKFELEDSRIVNLALSEFGYVSLEGLSTLPNTHFATDYNFIRDNLVIPGTIIDQKHSRMMKRDLKKAVKAEMMVLEKNSDGEEQYSIYDVWIGSTYGYLTSDFGHLMYETPFPKENEDQPDVYPDFAVVWSYRLDTDTWKYSLRAGKRGEMSADEAVDVSQIAARYGGGGHKAAAGFEIKGEDGHPYNIFNFEL